MSGCNPLDERKEQSVSKREEIQTESKRIADLLLGAVALFID